jgi:kinesin family protein 1
MYENATILTNPETLELSEDRQVRQVFSFDHSFWSMDEVHPLGGNSISSQKEVYDTIGIPVINSIFDGYNGCVMAYGQSGSGKTYTVMGGLSDESQGLIPRICKELFERIKTLPNLSVQVELSYMEIYAEQIRDLINPQNTSLRVREHPDTGPYVENLTLIPADDYYSVEQFILYGNQHRVTASTKLNDRSSRSHAILILYITQLDLETREHFIKSKLCLVDLAGSERVKDSGVTGIQLQEASNINTSLTTLGRVISILAKAPENSGGGGGGGGGPLRKSSSAASTSQQSFVPFRDSILTWLLKDTLGGNSKTVMIATISPSHINYVETLGTLQYAYRAKQIVNRVSVNAGKTKLLATKLRTELTALKEQWGDELKHFPSQQIQQQGGDVGPGLRQEMVSNISNMNRVWDKSVAESKQLQSQTIEKYKQQMDVVLCNLQLPFFIDMNPTDMSQDLIHYLPTGTILGSTLHPNFVGQITNIDNEVWVDPQSPCMLKRNGVSIQNKIRLTHGDRLTHETDPHFVFKFKIPICAI